MFKNLGKFKQWTGEKFGGAKVTMQTDDFQRLEQETENKREGYDRIVEAVDMVESHLLKRRTSPEDARNKVMPFEALGSCLYHYGTVFPEDSALGIALINLGQTETRIANLQEVLANEIKDGYKATLLNGIKEYKEYDYLRKKLASRRLDYDSKLNRLNKAKKEKPELEQEMQAARIKYQETEHDLIQKMAYMQEFENEHRDALYVLVEAQCKYHNQAKELFETIKNNWGQGSYADPRAAMMDNIIVRSNSIDSFPSVSQDSHRVSSHYHRTPDSSVDDYSSTTAASTNNHSADSLHHQQSTPFHSPPPPIVPQPRKHSTHEYEKYRRALFDFTGQNNDEITFKTGDVISVIDEIDKGWWLGEVHSKKGIFPVNYTEEYDPQKHPLPPLPAKSASPDVENVTEKPVHIEQHTLRTLNQEAFQSTPAVNETPDTPVIDTATTRRPPPPPASISSPVVQNSIGVSRTRSTAIRPPPPPPANARVNSTDSTTPLPPTSKSNSLPPHPIVHSRLVDEPASYLHNAMSSAHSSKENIAMTKSSSTTSSSSTRAHLDDKALPQPHHTAEVQAEDIQCNECECREYILNLFKKGYCNNCFHKHVL